MEIDVEKFRVRPGRRLDLGRRPTHIEAPYSGKGNYRKQLKGQVDQLVELQERLYAANAHAILLIFQAMDTGGKDGAIRNVMSGLNPQGTEVTSFKHPSATELQHDFLWRSTQRLPARGRIGIFNRSYYEEVLIVRVHPEILRAEGVPDGRKNRRTIWRERFHSIVEFEAHLHRSGTRILKFFLHISKEEQRRRLLARLNDPKKHWKASAADLDERAFWDQYMQAYEECLAATTTEDAPWYALPADDKLTARLLVAQAILDRLKSLKPEYPPADEDLLARLRQRLRTEG
jgi:PPK2 family polyphosphate:nucleotide phosphotransferase